MLFSSSSSPSFIFTLWKSLKVLLVLFSFHSTWIVVEIYAEHTECRFYLWFVGFFFLGNYYYYEYDSSQTEMVFMGKARKKKFTTTMPPPPPPLLPMTANNNQFKYILLTFASFCGWVTNVRRCTQQPKSNSPNSPYYHIHERETN